MVQVHTPARSPKQGGKKENKMKEEWRPIPGWEGYYEVSNGGRVRSLPRIITLSNGVNQPLKGKILSPANDGRTSHLRVNLFRGGKGTSTHVHRAVLEAFVGPCPDGMEACHWNDDPKDNRLENLRWGSRKENTLDKVRNGRHHNAVKTHCSNGHAFCPGNLVISKSNRRGCRACNSAYAYLSRHKDMKPHFQQIADRYFEKYAA